MEDEILDNRTETMPSGANLEITLAPFAEGERLFSAAAECLKSVKIDGNTDIGNIESNINGMKNAALSMLTSPELKSALLGCLRRCSYNGRRITSYDVFEPPEARQDYLTACWEVLKFNLAPFTKSLFTQLRGLMETTGKYRQ